MRNLFFLVIFSFFLLSVSGCGEGRPSKTASTEDMETGFEMVDQGRYDEALRYFQGLYENKPSDDTLKAWASVYVSRAGIKVTSLYAVFASLPKTETTKDNVWKQADAYGKSLAKIPSVSGDAREDLNIASEILEVRTAPSVRVFRAVINLVLLRSTFGDADKVVKPADLSGLDKNHQIICKLNWKFLRSWILTWSHYGLELKDDLDYAFPKKYKDWEMGEKFFLEAQKVSPMITKECEK